MCPLHAVFASHSRTLVSYTCNLHVSTLSHSVPSTEMWKKHHSRYPNASHAQTHQMSVRSIDRTFGTRSSSQSLYLLLFGIWHLPGLQEHLSCVQPGKVGGRIEMTGRRGRRRKQLLDEVKEKRRFWELKKEALDRTVWRNCFGNGCRPVIRQNADRVAATITTELHYE